MQRGTARCVAAAAVLASLILLPPAASIRGAGLDLTLPASGTTPSFSVSLGASARHFGAELPEHGAAPSVNDVGGGAPISHGYALRPGELAVHELSRGTFTFSAAAAVCDALPECRGFTVESALEHEPTEPVLTYVARPAICSAPRCPQIYNS